MRIETRTIVLKDYAGGLEGRSWPHDMTLDPQFEVDRPILFLGHHGSRLVDGELQPQLPNMAGDGRQRAVRGVLHRLRRVSLDHD